MRNQLTLAGLLAFALTAPAFANNFSWDYQRTGFRAAQSSNPQTAVSMRNNQTWPIVYGADFGMLNAYSLFPVEYQGQKPISGNDPTYWHPIGENLTNGQTEGSFDRFFQAASGATDGFGLSIQSPAINSGQPDVTVTGTYAAGFSGPAPNTYALEYAGNASIIASDSTLHELPNDQKIFDYAVSSFGDAAAITQRSGGNGPLSYWQRSPLLGNAWISQPIGPEFTNEVLYAATADLLFDSVARPHVLGVGNYFSSNTFVDAYRFDVISASWKSARLDTSASGQRIIDVAAAANDQGIIGAAWVNNGVLKYAFMDTAQTFPQWITTTVTTVTPTGQQLEPSQGVGLAYDSAGLPVISFVERNNRQIWIAYDPPMSGAIEGDFNADGLVGGDDLAQWTDAQLAGNNVEADADGDNDSDGADFLTWQRNLTPAPPTSPAIAVPEPTTLAIALLAASLLISRRPTPLQ